MPNEPPFVGESGVDKYGYPVQRPDKLKLLTLLRLRRFADLDRFITFYQDSFERDYRNEEWPEQAVSTFYLADPSLEPILDEWVASAPKSFASFIARGNYRYNLAWYYRGHKFASETSPAQFRSMDVYAAAARQDFEKALVLRPRLVAAYTRLLSIASNSGSGKVARRAFLQAGLATCPLCFEIRASESQNLTPRWGGSYEEMDRFARETEPLWNQNPRLRVLSGFADWDRCDVAAREERHADALRACDAALEAGDDTRFLIKKAKILSDQKEYTGALGLLDRALRIEPHNRSGLTMRCFVRISLEDVAGAAADLVAARQLDPTDSYIAEQVKWMIGKVRYEGQQLDQTGRHAEAANLFSLGLQIAPDDRDLMLRMAHSQSATGQTADTVQAQLNATPDDFELHQRTDYGLARAGRLEEVVAMWDEFISRHPNDPRAFLERAGAHWHMKHADLAISDMQHACDLGMSKACGDVEKMKTTAGR